jgi:hypothetical protein
MPHSTPGTSDEKLIEAETEILALRSQPAALRAAGDRSAHPEISDRVFGLDNLVAGMPIFASISATCARTSRLTSGRAPCPGRDQLLHASRRPHAALYQPRAIWVSRSSGHGCSLRPNDGKRIELSAAIASSDGRLLGAQGVEQLLVERIAAIPECCDQVLAATKKIFAIAT